MLILALLACPSATTDKGPTDSPTEPHDSGTTPTDTVTTPTDADSDGSFTPEDCDDQDPAVHPGQLDAWYDGVDSDCDGGNDFDADGDCFMPPAATADYQNYVDRWFPDAPPTYCVDPDDPFSDCLDEEGNGIELIDAMTAAGLVPADVHRSTATYPVVDVPYDAIDQDCAQDDDYDVDGDGFVPTVLDQLAVDDYAALWGYDDLVATDWVAGNPDAALPYPTAGDCDDTRFDTWPGALELLSDGVDQDCGGDGDAAPFGFGDAYGDFDWTGVGNPEVARLGDHVVVLVLAAAAKLPDPVDQIGIGLPFAASARGPALPEGGSYPYFKTPFATLLIQPVLDVAMDPAPEDLDGDGVVDPLVATLTQLDSNIIFYTYQMVNGLTLMSDADQLVAAGGPTSFTTVPWKANGSDLVFDAAGEPYALACADGRLAVMYSRESPAVQGALTSDGGDACWFDGSPAGAQAELVACTAGSCERYSVDDHAAFTDVGPDGESWAYGDQDEGWIALIDPTGAATVRELGSDPAPILPGWAVGALDVAAVGGTVYVAAIADEGNGPVVVLASGDPSIGLAEQILPFDDPSVDGEVPIAAGIYADADRVVVAVTATTGQADGDSVGWVFLGP